MLCNSGTGSRQCGPMKCYRGRLLRTPWPIPSHILITQAALCETFVEPGVGAFLGRSRVLSSHDHRFLGPFFRHTGSPERSIKLLKEPEGRVLRFAATPYSSFHFCVSINFFVTVFQFMYFSIQVGTPSCGRISTPKFCKKK